MKKFLLLILSFFSIMAAVAQVSKTINVTTAGTLSSLLTADEKLSVTNLTLTGDIDARDVKCLRDEMTLLAVVNISGVSIKAYSGTGGTVNYSTKYLANELPNYSFYNSSIGNSKTSLTNINLPTSLTSIGNSAFYNCKGFTGSLVIPSLVTSIGNSAFSNCAGFTGSLTLPNSVTTIGSAAFSNCTGFNGSLIIPTSVTTIGTQSFYNCKGFTGILVLPNSVTTIGSSAFSGCKFNIAIDDLNPNYATLDGVLYNKTITTLMFCPTSKTGSITIPNSVTSIDNSAFSGCNALTGNLVIPNSVTTIGSSAFSNCTGFTGSLTLPSSITTIESSVFFNCSGFTGGLFIPNSVNSISISAFYNCSGFTGNLTIPNTVTKIDIQAFYNCSGFTGNLTIPSSVTTIGDQAFYGCKFKMAVDELNPNYAAIDSILYNKTITTLICCPTSKTGAITIPNTVTSIGRYAFSNCNSLTGSLTIPNSVTSIGFSAFQNCNGFTGNLTLPSSVTIIDIQAFSNCTGFTGSLTIPNSVTTIGSGAFGNCIGFCGNLIIPSSVTSIGEQAFYGCKFDISIDDLSTSFATIDGILYNKGITTLISCPTSKTGSIIIPNTVSSISNSAFSNCSALTGSLIIPNSVISIGTNAFSSCTGFTGTLVIPSSVTSIGAIAFNGCSGFTGSTPISSSVTSIGNGAFLNCGLLFDVDAANPNYSSQNGVLYNKLKSTLIQCPISMSGSFTLPATVTTIGNNAFSNCINLTGTLSIPSNLTTIGSSAFANCGMQFDVDTANPNYSSQDGVLYNNLKTTLIQCPISKNGNLTLPTTVTAIGSSAFSNCVNLSGTLYIPNTLALISSYAFRNCGLQFDVDASNPNYSSLEGVLYNKLQTGLIQCPITKSGSFTLPSTVLTIGYSAFSGCNKLSSLTVKQNLTSISSYAFENCTGISSLYIYSATPVNLAVGSDVFNGVDKEKCTLYVPANSLELYRNASQWKDFTNIIQGELPSSIAVSTTSPVSIAPTLVTDGFRISGIVGNAVLSIYNMDGTMVLNKSVSPDEQVNVLNLPAGIYITKVKSSQVVQDGKFVKM